LSQLLKHRDAAIELQTVKPIITQFYERLREYTEEGTALSEKYLEMSESLCRGETAYHLSDAKTLRLKLLKLAEGVDLMSKKISALGTDTQSETYLKSRRFLLQTQIRRASVNFIKETLVGLPSLPSDEELVLLQEKRKEEIARRVEEERRRTQEARIKFRNLQEKRQETPKNKLSRSPSEQAIEYEKGFVLSSANTGEFATNISDDPMVQQMNIIRNYISKAREANRFDEVSMLESNLRDLQVEFKKNRSQAVSNTPTRENSNHNHYESFNLDKSESSEQLQARVSLPTKAGSNLPAKAGSNLPSKTGSNLPEKIGSNLPSKTGSNLPTKRESEDGRSGEEGGPRRPSLAHHISGRDMSAKPVLEEMARTVNSVRDYLPNTSMLKSLNPFGGAGSDDEYDASGKNPFSE